MSVITPLLTSWQDRPHTQAETCKHITHLKETGLFYALAQYTVVSTCCCVGARTVHGPFEYEKRAKRPRAGRAVSGAKMRVTVAPRRFPPLRAAPCIVQQRLFYTPAR
jgi:hypothetical protein